MSSNELNDSIKTRTGYTLREVEDSRAADELKLTLDNGNFRVEIPLARHEFYGLTLEEAAKNICERLDFMLYNWAPTQIT